MWWKKYSYYFGSIFSLLGGMRPVDIVFKALAKGKLPAPQKVQLRQYELQFMIRSFMDIWSIKETFYDRFYERFGFPLVDGWSVVDIGAGIGEFTVFAAALYPSCRVVGFEPFPESFSLLQENLRLNHTTNVRVFSTAVSGKKGDLLLDFSGGEPLQIQGLQQARGEASPASQAFIPVRSVTLDEALKEAGIKTCDLLKLDCEGAEYEILFQAPDSVWQGIQRIVMEYHDGVTCYSHADLEKFLTEKGYRVEVFPNVVHAEIGYLRAARN